jgi:hypothetical protein
MIVVDMQNDFVAEGAKLQSAQAHAMVPKLAATLWPNIMVKKAPPPDSKEWEGKSDKLQYFSSNPGAGD